MLEKIHSNIKKEKQVCRFYVEIFRFVLTKLIRCNLLCPGAVSQQAPPSVAARTRFKSPPSLPPMLSLFRPNRLLTKTVFLPISYHRYVTHGYCYPNSHCSKYYTNEKSSSSYPTGHKPFLLPHQPQAIALVVVPLFAHRRHHRQLVPATHSHIHWSAHTTNIANGQHSLAFGTSSSCGSIVTTA